MPQGALYILWYPCVPQSACAIVLLCHGLSVSLLRLCSQCFHLLESNLKELIWGHPSRVNSALYCSFVVWFCVCFVSVWGCVPYFVTYRKVGLGQPESTEIVVWISLILPPCSVFCFSLRLCPILYYFIIYHGFKPFFSLAQASRQVFMSVPGVFCFSLRLCSPFCHQQESRLGELVWGHLSRQRWWPGIIIQANLCHLPQAKHSAKWLFWYGDHKISEVGSVHSHTQLCLRVWHLLEFLSYDRLSIW